MSEYITHKNTHCKASLKNLVNIAKPSELSEEKQRWGRKSKKVCGDCFTAGPIHNSSGCLMRPGEYGK